MAATTTTLELQDYPAHSLRAADERNSEPSPRTSHDAASLRPSRVVESTVPDGGYGWVIVVSCAMLSWWAVGTTYAWGVIQTVLVDRGLSTPAVLSFIGGINASMISVMAIVNSRMVRAWGARKMAMVGVACMGGSELLSSFSVHNLGAFFFTAGLIMGLGIRYVSQHHLLSVLKINIDDQRMLLGKAFWIILS